jgi:hypothetical protein
MKQQKSISRRVALGSLATSPLLAIAMPAAAASSADAHLLALGRDHEVAAAQLDFAIEHGTDVAWNDLEKLGRVGAEILTIQAKTIDGLRVKARAACWALLGDLDPIDNMTLDKSMALSIVRDLIRLHDPSLEHSGALKKLVREIEAGASEAIATASLHF